MMMSNRSSLFGVLWWQRSLVFVGGGGVAWFVHDVIGWQHLTMPTAPASIIGAALGIFAAFRAHAAYARWWEGRQLWGRLVSASRMWASQCRAYLNDGIVIDRLVRRHALYVHLLRCQLRREDPFNDPHVLRLLDRLGLPEKERQRMRAQSSIGHDLLDEHMATLAAAPLLDPHRLQSLDSTIMTFLDVQGGCERLKQTPMPRSYGFFVERLLVVFSMLLPWCIVKDVGWLVIPVNVVVGLGFTLITETARLLEDPFAHSWHSLPITTIAVDIERDLTQRLGDADLPPAVVVNDQGILW